MTKKQHEDIPACAGVLRADAAHDLITLTDTMTRLRKECPWDKDQTLKTLRSYLLEEAHEVLEVLDALDDDGGGPHVLEHRDELGDLLLQIVFQSEIQREAGRFDLGDVAAAITHKLIRRHPHIFGGEGVEGTTAGTQDLWEAMKRKERAEQPGTATAATRTSALDGVPTHLPALLRAYRTGQKARGVGFDWPTHQGVLDKIKEELGEIEGAIAGGNREEISAEIGDLLYAVTNLARHFDIDAESSLRQTIRRFESRFRIVEQLLAAEGKIPEQTPLDELEAKWQQAKQQLASGLECSKSAIKNGHD